MKNLYTRILCVAVALLASCGESLYGVPVATDNQTSDLGTNEEEERRDLGVRLSEDSSSRIGNDGGDARVPFDGNTKLADSGLAGTDGSNTDGASTTIECANGLDDDNDGFTDYGPGLGGDPGCDSSEDASEHSAEFICDDGVDNDSDGLVDFQLDSAGDPDCLYFFTTRETPDNAASFFQHEDVATIELVFSDDDWETQLRAQPRDEIPGSFTYYSGADEETLALVGIRLAGLSSLGDGLSSGKFPWKIKFDHFVSEQWFRGLKGLRLKNMNDDLAWMEEALAFTMLQASGIPASRWRYVWVRVRAASDSEWTELGLYLAIEPVDSRFVDDRFQQPQDGNLYRCVWDWEPESYIESFCEAVTNESTPELLYSDLQLVGNLLEETPTEFLEETIAPLVDVGEYLQYFAASNAIADHDGINANWGRSFDYYLYYDPVSGRFFTIGWDLDRTWLTTNWCPYHMVDEIRLLSRFFELEQWRARYQTLLGEAAERIRSGFLEETRASLRAMIEPFVGDEIALNMSSTTLENFDSRHAGITLFLEERPDLIEGLANRPWEEALDCCQDTGSDEIDTDVELACMP